MSDIEEFHSQKDFDDILMMIEENAECEPISVVEEYDHDTVYLDKVGEGVEMLRFRLQGDRHYYYDYVKPKWYAFKVAREKLIRLLSLGRS